MTVCFRTGLKLLKTRYCVFKLDFWNSPKATREQFSVAFHACTVLSAARQQATSDKNWNASFCRCSLWSEEGIRSPRTGVTGSCEQPDMGLRLERGSSGRAFDCDAISTPGGNDSPLLWDFLSTRAIEGPF